MKIKDLSLFNFGRYQAVTASFSPSVTYLVGPNGAGKSTLAATGIQWMFEGMAEKATKGNAPVIGERFRFIGPDARSSKGEMTLIDTDTGAEIKVIRSMTKDANTVRFEGPAGMALDQSWLTALFSEYMIAPKKFMLLSPLDQAKALGIDTRTFDANIKALKEEYTAINRDITAIGTPEPVELVEAVDLDALAAEKEAERDRLNKLFVENKEANNEKRLKYEADLRDWNLKLLQYNEGIYNAKKSLEDARLHASGFCRALDLPVDGYPDESVQYWMNKAINAFEEGIKKPITSEQIEMYRPKEPEYIPEMPDDTTLRDIDARILTASQTNLQAQKYVEYVSKVGKLNKLKLDLSNNKEQQANEVAKRAQYIKDFKFPFDNLTVDDDGGLMFDGRPIKEPYFSTGELIKMIPILFTTVGSQLKCIFIQDFNLLDATRQQEVETFLTDAGYQLIIEYVGETEIEGKNCIVLTSTSQQQN